MCKAMDVARYMTSVKALDNLKIQKLLYYCQAVHMVLHGSSDNVLFKDDIQAWQYGPVVPNVYYKLKKYGFETVPVLKSKRVLTEDEIKTINIVLDFYGEMSGTRLINKTHQESPWKDAYIPNKNVKITPVSIYNFFKEKYEFAER